MKAGRGADKADVEFLSSCKDVIVSRMQSGFGYWRLTSLELFCDFIGVL